MERLFAKIKKETLNTDEKEKISSALRNFVAENPEKSIKSPFYESWFIFRQRTFALSVALVIVFVLAGGTVFASRNSLPGNLLYPIKMASERVESFTAVGPKAQAEVYVSHAVSRLQEVEQIVTSSGQLNNATRQEIQNKFEAQAQEAINNINQLKNAGDTSEASKIQSGLESSFFNHKNKITNFLRDTSIKTNTKEELANMISNIDSQLKNAKDRQPNGEVKGANTDARKRGSFKPKTNFRND
jgi:hypothetical protein